MKDEYLFYINKMTTATYF